MRLVHRYRLLFIRFTPEFLYLVPQGEILVTAPKLQEDWMGTQGISISLCLLSLFAGIPLLVPQG